MKEFQDWSSKEKDLKSWKIKCGFAAYLMCRYYKGLGTSTAKEGKEYFSNLARHVLPFAPLTSPERNLIDMCFKRSRCEERKEWIDNFDPESFIDYGSIRSRAASVEKSPVSIYDFINKELIQFSRQDCIRSIPSMIDGLKPSQRKVLHGCIQRNLTKEIKVVQLSGLPFFSVCEVDISPNRCCITTESSRSIRRSSRWRRTLSGRTI